MKTLSLLCVCAVLSVCWSTNDVEPEVAVDPDEDVTAEAAPTGAPADSSSSSSESNSDSASSSSESNSDSASSSSESNSSSSESDSSASDSASSSSSSSSESNSVEATTGPAAPAVIMKRDLASVLLRRSRRAAPAGDLTPLQQESLREVCELNAACDEMADTDGIVAAYTTYYGPVPF